MARGTLFPHPRKWEARRAVGAATRGRSTDTASSLGIYTIYIHTYIFNIHILNVRDVQRREVRVGRAIGRSVRVLRGFDPYEAASSLPGATWSLSCDARIPFDYEACNFERLDLDYARSDRSSSTSALLYLAGIRDLTRPRGYILLLTNGKTRIRRAL